jgi:hypothetical protein
MANATMTLISSNTVGSGGVSSIDFTSIPSTYTDLVLKISARTNRTGSNYTDDIYVQLNGDTGSNYGAKVLYGGNSATGSFGSGSGSTVMYGGYAVGTDGTVNTFGNSEIYIPNYAGSTNKSLSADGVAESNSTTGVYVSLAAGIRLNTAAINQVTLKPANGTLFLQYSTAYLYGVKNA